MSLGMETDTGWLRRENLRNANYILQSQLQIAANRRLVSLLGLVAATLGVTVLVGWRLDFAVLKTVLPGMVSMAINTALGMLFCGVALVILSRAKITPAYRIVDNSDGHRRDRRLKFDLCANPFLAGNLAWINGCYEFAHGGSTHIISSRMAPSTAFCFILTGRFAVGCLAPV